MTDNTIPQTQPPVADPNAGGQTSPLVSQGAGIQEDTPQDTGKPADPKSGPSIGEIAKKLSSWKDDFLHKPANDQKDKKDDGDKSDQPGGLVQGELAKDVVTNTLVQEDVQPQVMDSPAPVSQDQPSQEEIPSEPTVEQASVPQTDVTPDDTTGPVVDDVIGMSGTDQLVQEPPPVLQVEPVADTHSIPQADQTAEVPEVPQQSPVAQVNPVQQVQVPAADIPAVQDLPVESVASTEGPMLTGSAAGGAYPFKIEQLLSLVVEKDASDLHITEGYPAKIRIDGQLQNVSDDIVGEDVVQDLVLPILPESKRELLEVNREVDLAYSFEDDARFRVNAYYERGNVSAALRLIPNKIRSIEELKLPGTYHQLTKLPQGFVLVTGPTGHGKSTTLASIIQEINANQLKHIITIEDPIEYIYPRGKALVDQREMHEDTHSWEIALRSALRQDPDVVLVGEMRDFETIAAAITLAETGHLVFATLHTNNASQTIDRIIDVFPEHQQAQVRVQLSNILEAVISQRLIPIKGGGRRAVSEILLANPAVRNLIREGKSHQIDNVIRTSMDVGMKSLEHSLVELVREGVIGV